MDEESNANFSNQRSAIPFGKFEPGSDDEFPCNESMVGREGSRAKLIDFLTNAGTRKAILVTGRRGMGKTSFVQYCINEYEAARVERYWGSDVGRTFRALIWLILIGLLATAAFMVGNHTLQILIFNAEIPGNLFLWIPTAFLIFGLCYPLFYAGKILSVVTKRIIKSKLSDFIGFLSVTIIIILFIYFLPVLLDRESPLVMLSSIVIAIAAVYFVGELIDSFLLLLLVPTGFFFFSKYILIYPINMVGITGDATSYVLFVIVISLLLFIAFDKKKLVELLYRKEKSNFLGAPLQLLVGVTAFIVTYYIEPIVSINRSATLSLSNILLALMLLGLGAINHAVNLSRYHQDIKDLQISSIYKWTRFVFIILGVLFILPFLFIYIVNHFGIHVDYLIISCDFIINKSSKWNKLIGICIVITLFRLIYISYINFINLDEYKLQSKNPIWKVIYNKNTYIYPSSMLVIKAFFLIIFSLYAINPIIIFIYKHYLFTSQLIDTVFPQLQIDLAYIVMVAAIIVLLFWIEYEWIIRPGQFARRDRALYLGQRPGYYNDFHHPKSGLLFERQPPEKIRKSARNAVQEWIRSNAFNRKTMRDFQSLTFLSYFNHFHMSTLVSIINLGFEELEHRSVIHAMLLSIHEQYYEKFVTLRSPRVMIRTAFGLLVAMVIISHIAKGFFNVDSVELQNAIIKQPLIVTNSIHKAKEKYIATIPIFNKNNQVDKHEVTISEVSEKIIEKKYCQKHKKIDKTTNENIESFDLLPKLPRLLCELNGFYAEQILPIIYLELVPIFIPKNGFTEATFLHLPFDIRTPYYNYNYNYIYNLICDQNKKNGKCALESMKPDRMSICLYHLFLFGFIFYLFRRINRLLELVPYPIILEDIEDLIQGLTSNTKIKRNRDNPIYARWASALSGKFDENERSVEREKFDPREVELQFMRILDKVCHSRSSYFKHLHSSDSSPNVEITFVFDELDKLATDIYSQQQKGNPDGNDSELHRLNLMKGLLSNMKRIITSSEARYIFLGGRLIHDDWLADGARRQPLLTSIFSNEIYLPSLLTDPNIDWFDVKKPDDGTQELSGDDLQNGRYSLHERIEEYFVWQFYMARMRYIKWFPRIWMPLIGLGKRQLYPGGFIQSSYKELKVEFKNYNQQLKVSCFTPLQSMPIRYTNTGKHLNHPNEVSSGRELSRIRALIDFLSYRSAGNPKFLNELLASFMVSVDRAVPDPEVRRNDFSCQDVLYLPDHKVMRIQLIARVYQQLCKGFEDRIRGRDDKTIIALIYMSDFLFKFHNRAFSWENLELIDELVHMHRGHDLRILLHELVEHYSDRYLHRIVNGMYTYRFRSYFAKELDYLCRHSEEEMAAFNFTLDEAQALRDHLEKLLELGGKNDTTDILNMLGELHEFYQEYERARYYYRRCISLRHNTFKEYVGKTVGKDENEIALLQAINTNALTGREAMLALQNWAPSTLRLYLKIIITYEKEHNENDALNKCKLCIKFAETMIQAFANIGLNEKYESTVWSLYADEPALEDSHVLEYLGLLFEPLFSYAWLLEKNSHTNGNSLQVLKEGIAKYNEILLREIPQSQLALVQAQWNKKIGDLCFFKGYAQKAGKLYVDEACEYYALSAINLSSYFREHLRTNFNEPINIVSFQETLLNNQYPANYCFNIAECLGDLAESIFAKITPKLLFDTSSGYFSNIYAPYEDTAKNLVKRIDQWFFDSNRIGNICILDKIAKLEYDNDFTNLNKREEFDLALNLSLASSFYLLRAGQIESAAREAIQTVEIVAQYFNWYWLSHIMQGTVNNHWEYFTIFQSTIKKIVWFADYLHWLLIEVRPKVKNENSEPYLMGDLIPSSGLTVLCSIGLSLSLFLKREYRSRTSFEDSAVGWIAELTTIIQKWTGSEYPLINGFQGPLINMYGYFEQKLIYSLQRHRYPVLNQLIALKILVDSSLIRGFLEGDKDDVRFTHDWLQELHQINKKYDHPLHFTPMQTGLSFYLYLFLRKKEPQLKLQPFENFDLVAETRRLLVQSLDMCHMGRGYYHSIENLYYLYDDFNDNQIHKNHAMQMAAADLNRISLGKIRELEDM